MIIGISGYANSGKDTVAEYIQLLDRRYEKRSFAYKLKQMAAILTGFEDQFTREGKAHYLPQWGMTVGEIQQRLGTDAIRNGLRNDAWVIALLQEYTPHQYWVVSDARFPNEIDAIRQLGGYLVRINRDIADDCGRDAKHPSETALDNRQDWDFVIWNTQGLNELYAQVGEIIERIKCLSQ